MWPFNSIWKGITFGRGLNKGPTAKQTIKIKTLETKPKTYILKTQKQIHKTILKLYEILVNNVAD